MEFLKNSKFGQYVILNSKWLAPLVIVAILLAVYHKQIAAKLLEMRTKKDDRNKVASPIVGGPKGTTLTSPIRGGGNVTVFQN
jgi:hypothetical protein